ncbi:MAG TPA: fumarylacetoacetate hydrolase family protein [Pseudomonadales bacterium]|nr:fumarylacetoacetate hydrolase family protein [Pseudomonadales bacterium]
MHEHHHALFEQFWRAAIGATLDVSAAYGKYSIDDALAVQLDILDRWCSRGESLGGWKVGLTSGSSRDAFGKGIRPFGHVLRNRVIASDDELKYAYIKHCGVENELCFIMDRDLRGSAVTAASARAAVRGVAPAFEINETRVTGKVDAASRVADNLSQWGIVVGPVTKPIPDDFDFDALEIVLRHDGVEVERTAARGHIDDHFESLATLTRQLAKFDRGLRAGDRIITGSFTRQPVTGPGRWDADFGPLGTVAIRFS